MSARSVARARPAPQRAVPTSAPAAHTRDRAQERASEPRGRSLVARRSWATVLAPMPVLRSSARTDVGRRRKHNEDAYLIDDALGLYVVADGMGGHAAGEVASAQAVRSIREALADAQPVLESFGRAPTVEA